MLKIMEYLTTYYKEKIQYFNQNDSMDETLQRRVSIGILKGKIWRLTDNKITKLNDHLRNRTAKYNYETKENID